MSNPNNQCPCPKCGSLNKQTISEPTKIQKEVKIGYIIGFLIFATITIIGLVILLANLTQDNTLSIKGICITALGLTANITLLIWQNIDTSYKIEYKVKYICLDCGKKIKIHVDKENQ